MSHKCCTYIHWHKLRIYIWLSDDTLWYKNDVVLRLFRTTGNARMCHNVLYSDWRRHNFKYTISHPYRVVVLRCSLSIMCGEHTHRNRRPYANICSSHTPYSYVYMYLCVSRVLSWADWSSNHLFSLLVDDQLAHHTQSMRRNGRVWITHNHTLVNHHHHIVPTVVDCRLKFIWEFMFLCKEE